MIKRPTGHMLVLVADDEAHIRMVVADRLRAAGFEVIEARDGEEAWEFAQQESPDAVVTDLQMPFMTGVDLCTKMRGHAPTAETPALLLTARGHILDEAQLAGTSIRAVMSKPFSVREVTAKVQEMISARGDVGGSPGVGKIGAGEGARTVREAA